MELTLRILLGLVTFICLAGGANLLIKGTGAFLQGVAATPVLDNLFRFLSGIYFGLGFLMLWVDFHFHEMNGLICMIGIVVVCSGLGRLYSVMKLGSAGKYFDYMMVIEIILGSTIILLQYLR